MVKNKNETTEESKYIQQHLANERTFLAWVRTAIAIVGIGFLITNLHMDSVVSRWSDSIVFIIGIASVATGLITIITAAWEYFVKINSINQQTFQPSKIMVFSLTVLMVLIILTFGIYFLSL
jgi:putative membrane protein